MTLKPKFGSWRSEPAPVRSKPCAVVRVWTGAREEQRAGEFSHDLENVYLTIACSESQEAELIEAIRPSLKKFGGMCLVSDAMWVIHEA